MPDRIFDKHYIDPSHFFFHDKIKISEHAALYLTNTLRTTALGLIGVFLPIYIFELAGNYPIFSSDALISNTSWVLSYYFLMSGSGLVFLFTFSRILFKKIPLNVAIFVSLLILVVEVSFWIIAKQNLYFIWVAGILGGFRKVFYWLPYHVLFEKKFSNATSHFGKSTAKRQFLVKIISGITPAIGGIVLTQLGFTSLFALSIGLLLLAGIPVLFILKDWKHNDHNPIEVFKNITLNKKYRLISSAHFGQGMEALVVAVFWPLMMLFILANFEKIGFLNSASFIMASITTLIIGRFVDKYGTKVIHAFGVGINSILYIFKLFIAKPASVYLVDVTDRANSPLYAVPTMSVAYEKAEKIGRSDYHIFRETMLNFGVLFTSVLTFLLLHFNVEWRFMFLIALVGGLASYLINFDKH